MLRYKELTIPRPQKRRHVPNPKALIVEDRREVTSHATQSRVLAPGHFRSLCALEPQTPSILQCQLHHLRMSHLRNRFSRAGQVTFKVMVPAMSAAASHCSIYSIQNWQLVSILRLLTQSGIQSFCGQFTFASSTVLGLQSIHRHSHSHFSIGPRFVSFSKRISLT